MEAIELDHGHLVFSNFLLQNTYGIDVGLAAHSVFQQRQNLQKDRNMLAYVDYGN